jgi:type III secretion system YscI/HrpB-like protein
MSPDQGLVRTPSQSDVDVFDSAMRSDALPASGHLSEMVAGALSGRLDSTASLSQQSLRSLKKASATGDPMDIAKVGRELSTFSHEMAVATKVISKGTQAIDKLTNMQ